MHILTTQQYRTWYGTVSKYVSNITAIQEYFPLFPQLKKRYDMISTSQQ